MPVSPPLAIVPFPNESASERVRPLITAESRAHYDALSRGVLLLQRCGACHRHRFPWAPVCPWCHSREAGWVPASGRGVVHSWVRYHRGYVAEFRDLAPYAVLAVELDEGPVVVGRLVGDLPEPAAQEGASGDPVIGTPAQALVERWHDGFCALAFNLAEPTP